MYLKLDSIFENEGSKSEFDYIISMDGSDIPEDSCFVSGIRCKGSVENHTGMVVLCGQAVFDYAAACDRCAAVTKKQFTVPIYHKLINHLYGEDNDEYIIVESSGLDLDELIYEDVVLELPMRYLCREDCKGLCPVCGQDLNKGDCGCKKPIDPRLAALKQLLED